MGLRKNREFFGASVYEGEIAEGIRLPLHDPQTSCCEAPVHRGTVLGLLFCSCIWPSALLAASPSALLQLDFRAWSSWTPASMQQDGWITRTVRVRAGDTLGTLPERQSWGKGPVFRILRVEGPGKVWVRFHPSIAPLAPRLAVAAQESVLVTTVRRMFGTRSYDAGLSYSLTVVDSSATSPSLPLTQTGKRWMGSRDLEEAVWSMRVIALGRATRFRRDPSERSYPQGILSFAVEEVWKGPAGAGDTIEVTGPLRLEGNDRVYVPRLSTPILRGDRVILFLQPPVEGAPKETMRLWLAGGLAQKEQLVFEPEYLGKGVPLDTCRARIRRAVAELQAPYTGRFAGRIVDAGSGNPVRGASIRDLASQVAVACDDSGRFEMRFLPIGYRRMEITAPCYTTLVGQAPISDETANELWIPLKRRDSTVDCR